MSLWSKPRETADGNLAAEEYRSALAKFTPSQLDAGWVALRDSHEGRSWPTIFDVRRAVLSKSVLATPRTEEKPQHFPEFANSIMQSNIAARAMRDGWLLSLWDFCDQNGRAPTEHESSQLIRETRIADEKACQINQSDALGRALYRIWGAMKARESNLCQMVRSNAASLSRLK